MRASLAQLQMLVNSFSRQTQAESSATTGRKAKGQGNGFPVQNLLRLRIQTRQGQRQREEDSLTPWRGIGSCVPKLSEHSPYYRR